MTNSSSKQVEPELKACPLAGHLPEGSSATFGPGPYVSESGDPDATKYYAVVCPGCCSTAHSRSRAGIIKRWNTRVPVVSTAPGVDARFMVHEPTGVVQCNDSRCPVGSTTEGWPHSFAAPDCIYHTTVASLAPARGSYYEQAMTVNWEVTNARRHELITKKADGLTDDEANELRELQWLAGIKREILSGPLPFPLAPKEEEAEEFARRVVGTVFENTGASHETLKQTMIERIADAVCTAAPAPLVSDCEGED